MQNQMEQTQEQQDQEIIKHSTMEKATTAWKATMQELQTRVTITFSKEEALEMENQLLKRH